MLDVSGGYLCLIKDKNLRFREVATINYQNMISEKVSVENYQAEPRLENELLDVSGGYLCLTKDQNLRLRKVATINY